MSPISKPLFNFPIKNFALIIAVVCSVLSSLVFYSCSSAKRTTSTTVNDRLFKKTISVLIDELPADNSFKFETDVVIKNSAEEIIPLKQNSPFSLTLSNGFITAAAGKRNYIANQFDIVPQRGNAVLDYKGKKFKGGFKIGTDGNKLYLINELTVEDYLKGVIPLEMGNIKGDSNFEALKAFAIIARNYSYMKLDKRNGLFDVYSDTRDQVYGGASVEKEAANKAIEETSHMILTYEHSPAKVFYFSSCGGFTEEVGNVFSEKNIPYLTTVKDENEPLCKIAPNFSWSEKYTGKTIVKRLFESKLIESTNYSFKTMTINSRHKSGRVNELSIVLETAQGVEKEIRIYSNNIRKIIKLSNGSGILKSTMFNLSINKNGTDSEIEIQGKGNGHGVGLCQWGAIAKSRKGDNYKEILYFYFPGTRIEKIDD